jgi:hypothetical protein
VAVCVATEKSTFAPRAGNRERGMGLSKKARMRYSKRREAARFTGSIICFLLPFLHSLLTSNSVFTSTNGWPQ